MNSLPKELEDIIMTHKYQLDHEQKFRKCLRELTSNSIAHLEQGIRASDMFEIYNSTRRNNKRAARRYSKATAHFNSMKECDEKSEQLLKKLKKEDIKQNVLLGVMYLIVGHMIYIKYFK